MEVAKAYAADWPHVSCRPYFNNQKVHHGVLRWNFTFFYIELFQARQLIEAGQQASCWPQSCIYCKPRGLSGTFQPLPFLFQLWLDISRYLPTVLFHGSLDIREVSLLVKRERVRVASHSGPQFRYTSRSRTILGSASRRDASTEKQGPVLLTFLRSHWLKFLRHVTITLVIQGPGTSTPTNVTTTVH